MGNEDSQNADMELKGNNALDVSIIEYLQTCEVPKGFIPNNMTTLCVGPTGSNAKLIPFCKCG
jgi:hypothetical protein